MLWQLHIFDIKTSDPQLQNAYLANALVNTCGLRHIFYKIDLLLKHQNREFKRFQADKRLSLQETDPTFWLHALSITALWNVKQGINKIIVGRDYTSKQVSGLQKA